MGRDFSPVGAALLTYACCSQPDLYQGIMFVNKRGTQEPA
jgi:hypothetical protein